jgi:ABC-2 type transport system permease protein
MRLQPGGVPWLLAWDLRLAWRGLSARVLRVKKPLGHWRTALNLLLLLGMLHLIGWSLLRMATVFHPDAATQRLLLGGVLLSALLSSVSFALSTAVNLLFVRNDLDLLCTSPIPLRNVFAARCLSIAVQALTVPGMLALPAANMAAIRGDWRWLAAYPVALALGLAATALALGLTILLVRAIGPRGARTVALVLSTLLGAAFFLTMQAPNLLGHERGQRWSAGLRHWANTAAVAAPDSWIWYPARAVHGEPWPLLCTLAAGGLCFFLAVLWLPYGFAFALRHAAGVAPTAAKAKPRIARFGASLWWLMLVKEWRLILRDPQMLTLLLQQTLGLLPGLLFLGRGHAGMPAAYWQGSVAAACTFVACMLAGTLAWLALSAEDAPELLACAPHPRGRLRRYKLVAVLAPLWLLAALPLLWIERDQPWLLLCALLCVGGGSLGSGVFQLWLPMPGSRRDLRNRLRRGEGSSLDRVLAQIVIYFGWAGFAWCLGAGYWSIAALLLPVALAGPAYAWLRRRDSALLY